MNRRANEIADIASLTTLSEVLQCDTTFPQSEDDMELIAQGLLVADVLCEIQILTKEGLKDHTVLQRAVTCFASADKEEPPTDEQIAACYIILPQLAERVLAKFRVMKSALELCRDGFGDIVPEENRCELGRLFEHLCEASSEGGLVRDTIEFYTDGIYAEIRNEIADEERNFTQFRRRDVPRAVDKSE